ncbi:cyclase family protein [Mesobacterium pallidum]|uniref:cyclase family protein n=1 Tax=Mesobacterium pallidum TaxID=2872037 RepID=UPI001EE2D2A5|nr:cyclase family protein [Mesobacterium pallidum]
MCTDLIDVDSLTARPGASTRPRGGYDHIDAAATLAALSLVRHGKVMPLNLALDTRTIGRPEMVHHARMQNQTRPIGDGRFNVVNDDWVELALQSHSHWDALAHWGVIEPGDSGVFYNNTGLEDTYPEFGSKTLGMATLSGGIVTRGVFFDMVRFLGADEQGYLPTDRNIDAATINAYLDQHGLTLRPGDAAIFYTGFQNRVRANPDAWRAGTPGFNPVSPGVLPDTLDIWEAARTFALVADNPSVEPNPMGEGKLHAGALKRLGIYLGELFSSRTSPITAARPASMSSPLSACR